MNWLKERVGIQDPIYGPSAIQSVAEQADTVPCTEITRDDLRWAAMGSTCVETQTFYATADSGHIAMAQVIYSNVAGIRTTCQFSCKIFYNHTSTPDKAPLWTSDPLKNYGFDETKHCFHADNCALTLSEDGTSYHIKSTTSKEAAVDCTFTRAAPGFVAGKNGTSTFGTDPAKPWGSMRHAFWPRCNVTGSILTKADGAIDLAGRGLFIHALQGIRPNLAAASWNFLDFQGPNYSAVMMEFTTPPSYGSTVVNVGGVVADGKILYAGARHTVAHTATQKDEETGWLAPTAARFHWHADKVKTKRDADFDATIEGSLDPRLDRIDVLFEVPGFVKQIVAQAAGTKPYIYQYGPKTTLTITGEGDGPITETGTVFSEATFITGST